MKRTLNICDQEPYFFYCLIKKGGSNWIHTLKSKETKNVLAKNNIREKQAKQPGQTQQNITVNRYTMWSFLMVGR